MTSRKALKTKILKALSEEIQDFSPDMKDILADDLVTAFESRCKVLNNSRSNLECHVDFGVKVIQ